MSVTGVASTPNTAKSDTKDVEQQIKDLEKKETKLQQDLQKEDNPFALKQSKDYEETKQEIQQLDVLIQQLKASIKAKSNSAADPSSQKIGALMQGNSLKRDEFVHGEDQAQQSGIYSITVDENGNPKISFDKPQAEKGLSKKEDKDDKLVLKNSSDEVEAREDEDKL